MYDIEEIREKHSCIDVIRDEIGEPNKHNGYYASWRCPFCGKHSNSTFTAWADCWKCWKGCTGGDVISFIQKWRGLSFGEACRYLGGELAHTANKFKPKTPTIKPDETPTDEWINDASIILDHAQKELWQPRGKQGLDYLHSRGFNDDTIKSMGFGYIPQTNNPYWRGINIPHAIVIPSYREGKLWNARYRRFTDDPTKRYINMTGGKLRGSLFGGDTLRPWEPIILTEGDFNAAILRQVGYNAVSLSSASNKLSPHWLKKFLTATTVLVWGDNDQAGGKFESHHTSLGTAFKGIMSNGGDANDLYLAGGQSLLSDFVGYWLSVYDKGINDFEAYGLLLGGVVAPLEVSHA